MATTYNNLYLDTRTRLKKAGIERGQLEARELICYAADKSREQFYRDMHLYASGELEKRVDALVQRRLGGEPVAYIVGEWEFYGLPLNVVREGRVVYFHGAQAGRKAACLQKAPRVCLTCVETCEIVPERYTTRYASAVAFGRVEEITEPEEKVQALRLLCRRYTPEHLAGAEKEIIQSLRGTAVWKLTVDEITGKANRP